MMQRYFIQASDRVDSYRVRITGDDFHHITRVMRLREGDRVYVVLLDQSWLAEIAQFESDAVFLQLIERNVDTSEAALRLTIIQGLPKGDKIDLIIRQSCELGAASLIVFQALRSVAHIPPEKRLDRVTRWRKMAKEAAEQAQRTAILQVEYCTDLQAAIACLNAVSDADSVPTLIVPYEAQDQGLPSLKTVLQMEQGAIRDHSGKLPHLAVVIGPEGGFDPREILQLQVAGGKLCTLGSRILRTETVSTAVSAMIFYEFDQLGGEATP